MSRNGKSKKISEVFPGSAPNEQAVQMPDHVQNDDVVSESAVPTFEADLARLQREAMESAAKQYLSTLLDKDNLTYGTLRDMLNNKDLQSYMHLPVEVPAQQVSAPAAASRKRRGRPAKDTQASVAPKRRGRPLGSKNKVTSRVSKNDSAASHERMSDEEKESYDQTILGLLKTDSNIPKGKLNESADKAASKYAGKIHVFSAAIKRLEKAKKIKFKQVGVSKLYSLR